jgi:predicted nucleic acid-binding protein
MRLVVLDTNVIVSAGIAVGTAPAALMMDWVLEGLVQVVTCPSIVAEYREVAGSVKFHRYGFPPYWLEFLIEESLYLPDPEGLDPGAWFDHDPQIPDPPIPDPKDMPFLALAHAAGAWLVTGNLKHFPESIRHGVKVLSPAEYLAHLNGD